MKRQKHSKGYWLVFSPNHPYANGAGFVPEQRLIMEEIIGKYINPLVEDVHHRDENITNNKPDNLQLLTKLEHRRIHSGWLNINGEWWKTCKGCEGFLKVEGNFYRRHNGHNEYMTMCKNCIKQRSAESRPPKLTHEERSLIARQAVYKAWETRRKNTLGRC